MTLINRLVNAAPLPEKFKSPGFLRSSASVAEQILLSATNFIAALVVVGLSGMESLGIYSVVLVMANYAKSLFATLFHRQMVLAISAKHAGTQKGVLSATVCVQLVFAGLLAILCVLLGYVLSSVTSYPESQWLMFTVAAYIVAGSLFELFRQFLYATDRQVFSLQCTISAVAIQVIGFASLFVVAEGSLPVFWYFLMLAGGYLGGCIANHLCIKVLREEKWRGWGFAFGKLRSCWKHARFSVIGMTVTWLQNQSVTPLLLILTNPLIVGYFSFARLMVMPLSVINQGLVNNSTPQLRRLAEKRTPESVTARLRELSNINLGISVSYIALLGFGHFTGIFDKLVPQYEHVNWFLGFWVVSLIVTMQRFWISQFFVVHMRFKFLLYASTIVAVFSLIGMITTGLLSETVTLPLLFFIGGELLFIIMLWHARRNYAP